MELLVGHISHSSEEFQQFTIVFVLVWFLGVFSHKSSLLGPNLGEYLACFHLQSVCNKLDLCENTFLSVRIAKYGLK